MTKPRLIVICGPTASGKTALAVRICHAINGEVISCDSMQVYRGMDIGTAKPSTEEKMGIAHHMIDIADPKENYSVSQFRDDALPVIESILSKGKIPVLCGGTGLYIDALTKHMSFSGDCDLSMRNELKAISFRENGKEILYDMLKSIDPQWAAKLHENDVRRVIRAIEVFRITGVTMSDYARMDEKRDDPYNVFAFAPEWDRMQLYDRIDKRFDEMIQNGLVEEVKQLLDVGVSRQSTAMQAIGYKQIAAAICNECSLENGIRDAKLASRHYAKRQMTWFRRDKRVRWVTADSNTDSICDRIIKEFYNADN